MNAFFSYIFEARYSGDGALYVDSEHVPVQLVQPEGKVFIDLLNEDGVDLIAADLQRVALQFQVDRQVVVPEKIEIFFYYKTFLYFT